MTQRALQLCPNDHPPFLDVCRNHAAALAQLGMDVDTVFFGAPRGDRWSDATYFGIEQGTRRMTTSLHELAAGRGYRLVIAHRYRAYQVATLARSVLGGAMIVTVAHEFGMFAMAAPVAPTVVRKRRVLCRRVSSRGGRDATLRGASARALVLPNPADVARFDAALLPRAAARERLGIPLDRYIVGAVGRLHPKNGHT